jgi:hypothetical protein
LPQHRRTGVLTIENLDTGDPAFTFRSSVSRLLPGRSSNFVVRFSPIERGFAETFIVIDSDDPDDPRVRVGAAGGGR